VFVSFEGIDGSGKSTQARLLADRLRQQGREVVAVREPGGTELGERVRDLLLDGASMAPWAEAALFASARAQLVAEVVAPALERGATVVCDRFLDSSLAYQGIARGLGVEAVLEVNRLATGGVLPDRTVLLTVPVEQAAARAAGPGDRIEREGEAFLERVAAAYLELAAMFPQRIAVVDGSFGPDEVAARVRAAVGV
jgi:dTMP kinase